MRPSDHEEQWYRLLDAIEPDAAELAAVEAGLREFEDAPPLSSTTIANLVAHATAAPALTRMEPAAAPRVLTGRRLLLIAAALLLALPSVAWFARGLFVAQKFSPRDLTFGQAIAICVEPGENEDKIMAAIGVIRLHCWYGTQTLQTLRTKASAEPATVEIAERAGEALKDARAIATGESRQRPTQVPPGFESALAALSDANATPQVLMASMEVVRAHLHEGLRALVAASIADPGRAAQRQLVRDELVQMLSQ